MNVNVIYFGDFLFGSNYIVIEGPGGEGARLLRSGLSARHSSTRSCPHDHYPNCRLLDRKNLDLLNKTKLKQNTNIISKTSLISQKSDLCPGQTAPKNVNMNYSSK